MSTTTTQEFIPIQEALELLRERTGYAPDQSVVNQWVYQGKVRAEKIKAKVALFGNPNTRLFNAQDLTVVAHHFNEMRGYSVSSDDAKRIFHEHCPIEITDEQFGELRKRQNIPPVAVHMWKFDFFQVSGVIAAAQRMTQEKLESLLSEQGLLTITQAVKRIKDRTGNEVKENTLFGLIERGKLRAVKPPEGTRQGYKLYPADVDSISIREWVALPEPKIPEDVGSTDELLKLAKKYGELVTGPEAEAIVLSKAPHAKQSNIQHRIRRHVQPVARFGSTFWYQRKYIDAITVQPLRPASKERKEA